MKAKDWRLAMLHDEQCIVFEKGEPNFKVVNLVAMLKQQTKRLEERNS